MDTQTQTTVRPVEYSGMILAMQALCNAAITHGGNIANNSIHIEHSAREYQEQRARFLDLLFQARWGGFVGE